jgi:hypothetical protein
MIGPRVTRWATTTAPPRSQCRVDPAKPAGSSSDEPSELKPKPSPDADRRAEFEALISRQLELLGEDPARDGLQKTPARVPKRSRGSPAATTLTYACGDRRRRV